MRDRHTGRRALITRQSGFGCHASRVMRALIPLFLFAPSPQIRAQGWVYQLTGADNMLSAVSFSDSQQGTIVGHDNAGSTGLILRTTDGGTSWVRQSNGTSVYLQAVHFPD